MNQSIVFFLLHNSLVLILVLTGFLLSRKNRDGVYRYNYWVNSIFCILAYSFIEGFRYNRGADYMHHKNLIEKANNIGSYWTDSDKIEPLFQFINILAKSLELPYYFVFFIYSLILIFSIFYFLRDHRKVILFAVPLSFFATIVQSENLIRQFLALGFILLSISWFLKDSWLKSAGLFVCSILIHTSSIFYLPFFIIFKFVKKPYLSLYLIVLLYIVSWLWKAEYWLLYLDYITIFTPTKYAAYLTNEEVWTRMKFDGSTFYLIRLFCFNLGILTLGYRILEKYKNTTFPFFYNLFVLGAITQHLGLQSELVHRVSLLFYIFWFVVLSYICYDTLILKTKRTWIKVICFFLLINSLYDCISKTFKFDEPFLFIWDI